MGYQALLFCPDEKTARTVTQVLNELEFNVESCLEPFAAVKKLMGQHFDAVVVDCDNEQNATLLFKSARNSTHNQASLAVAVVEGQAGVAKAFRIGANLVLTKPINLEQSKGTLRVARGLLRKGDPAKPAVAAPAAAPAAPATPAAPAKPVAVKPVAPAKPVAPSTLSAATAARPAATPVAKPVARPAAKPVGPTPAAASAIPAVPKPAVPAAPVRASAEPDDDLLDIGATASVPAPPAAASVAPAPAFNQFGVSDSQISKPSAPASSLAAEVKTAFTPSAAHASGAASAPAPAREVQDAPVAAAPASAPAEAAGPAQPADAAQSGSSTYVGAEPSFTFGGANLPEKSSGGSKKILIGVAAAVLVGAVLFIGWTQFKGHESQPAVTQAPTKPAPVPVSVPQAPQSSSATPVTATPATLPPSTSAVSPKSAADANDDTSDDNPAPEHPAAPVSTKPSNSASPAAGKTAAEAKSGPAPLVVKGGTAPTLQAAPAMPDVSAPSMTGIATTGAGAPPPNLVSNAGSAPKPILQTLNISQGVSQGLIVKQVQPVYPRNALTMRVEGAVELMATISKTGDITNVKIVSGDGQLTKAASDAVKQWKYRPYMLNGEPVEIQTQITVNFKLPR